MPPSAGKYLQDILDAAQLVIRFTRGKAFTDYESDILTRSAVERQLTVLCEAMTQLDVHYGPVAVEITDHKPIIGMRIVLVHRYADLDNRRVWDTIESKLPTLIQEVEALLAEA